MAAAKRHLSLLPGKTVMDSLGEAQFGVSTFLASGYRNDQCGANGLPLTPNSIKIYGKFQGLKKLKHPHLCQYIDMARGKHERLMVVHEHYQHSLAHIIASGTCVKYDKVPELMYGILEALTFLNQHGIVHRDLSPSNILFDSQNNVKVSNYGLYHVTYEGSCVSFPIGHVKYLPPEVLVMGPVKINEHMIPLEQSPSAPKTDVWSLGVILLEVIMGKEIWPTLSTPEVIEKVLKCVMSNQHPLDAMLDDSHFKLQNVPSEVVQLLRKCLTVDNLKRPTPVQLMNYAMFQNMRNQHAVVRMGYPPFSSDLRCKYLDVPVFEERCLKDFDHLAKRSVEEVFYLWQLAGGDLEGVLKKAGLIKMLPPINVLPDFVIDDGEPFGHERDRSVLLNNTVITVSLDQLRQRLHDIEETEYYRLLEDESSSQSLPTSPSSVGLTETAGLPLVIREKDVEYQFHRIILYKRLLEAYPYQRQHIWKEARVDIPPLFRGHVWAALLEVEGDIYKRYESIDKETSTATDRQIEVDIPRCHQYDELLSSPEAHCKFKRLLKAWVVNHPQYVYWQGLDSLCAPFLALNFNDEALAYSCLEAFIPKYLNKFFLKDNSLVIQEYLAVFSHLIAFHEPELSEHLNEIGFIPDLYAIPWFLTMYAHVFPLHKIFHLWDTLLLGNSSFPLCIGVAILQQLKNQLMTFGFNECILLFSDMPEIDIENCVRDSIKIFCSTPKSSTYRQYARQSKRNVVNSARPILSYYSADYHDMPKNELSMDAIPLEELKGEKCPRISAEDLIELSELAGPASTKSPTKKTKHSRPKLIVIDIRNQEDFNRGTIPGSINVPHTSAFGADKNLDPSVAVLKLNSSRHLVKVVVGSWGKSASEFSSELVHLGYNKVCILHKGIDSLRSTQLLTVPSPDI